MPAGCVKSSTLIFSKYPITEHYCPTLSSREIPLSPATLHRMSPNMSKSIKTSGETQVCPQRLGVRHLTSPIQNVQLAKKATAVYRTTEFTIIRKSGTLCDIHPLSAVRDRLFNTNNRRCPLCLKTVATRGCAMPWSQQTHSTQCIHHLR